VKSICTFWDILRGSRKQLKDDLERPRSRLLKDCVLSEGIWTLSLDVKCFKDPGFLSKQKYNGNTDSTEIKCGNKSHVLTLETCPWMECRSPGTFSSSTPSPSYSMNCDFLAMS
jgi:hypothetical protein